jgi:DNA-binding PadR family transcriptional regulator
MNTNDIKSVDGRNPKVLYRRLNHMLQCGLVGKAKEAPHPGVTRVPTVYTLTDKGAETLVQLQITSNSQKLDHRGFHTDIQRVRILGRFKGALTLALKDRSDIDLVQWDERRLPDSKSVTAGKAKPDMPDAYFRIRNSQETIDSLLVCDRLNITERVFLQNLRGYQRWHWMRCCEHPGVPNLEILVVAATETRKSMFMAETQTRHQTASSGLSLLFGCEDDLSLDCPDTILQAIWQTPWSSQWRTARFASSRS